VAGRAVSGRLMPFAAVAALALGACSLRAAEGPAKADTAGENPRVEGKLILEDRLDRDLANWQSEGPHAVEVKNGRLQMKTVQDDRNVGQYVWCRKDAPADFRAEWDFTPLSESGFFLVFFCAQGVKGEDILSRALFEDYMPQASWKPYQDFDKYTSPPNRKTDSRIACYHVSYRRNAEANCNLRRNPGLHLLRSSEIQAALPAHRTFHVVLVKQGARIRLAVDGKPFMDHTDDGQRGAVHGAGKIGFRQVYDSDGAYSNFRLFDLTGEAGKESTRP